MTFVLYTDDGKLIQFRILECAKLFQSIYGGIIKEELL